VDAVPFVVGSLGAAHDSESGAVDVVTAALELLTGLAAVEEHQVERSVKLAGWCKCK
jgi:hypothetical protein